MSLLQFEQVSLEYRSAAGHTTILRDVTLHIESGEFVTLLGPSGCGKSTMLKLAAGIQKPSSGMVTFQGAVITGPDRRRGMMFQDPHLFPWLTVAENTEFGLKMSGLADNERKQLVDRYLAQMGLSSFANYPPYELSGGMKQRVALARTLVNNPDILLMDEPLTALDALTRYNMQELILDIWRETGKTIVFVTHDVTEALRLGTRLIVLSGSPARVLMDQPVRPNLDPEAIYPLLEDTRTVKVARI